MLSSSSLLATNIITMDSVPLFMFIVDYIIRPKLPCLELDLTEMECPRTVAPAGLDITQAHKGATPPSTLVVSSKGEE